MTLERSRRVYRALVRLVPGRLRARHACEMETLFLDTLREAYARGGNAVGWVWVRAVADVLRAAVRERLRRRPSLSASVSRAMARPWRSPAASDSRM